MSRPDDRAEAGTPPRPGPPRPGPRPGAAPTARPAGASGPVTAAADPAAGPPAPRPTPSATDPVTDPATREDAPDAPVDPVRRDLAQVAEAMAAVRAGVPAPTDVPEVPGDDEVAGLEQAHTTLRTALDRVERGG